ncbi:hypothetical protein QA644_10685 [Rhizobium sp. CC1099]|uniref:hypothetical protein n=1 Tax=Rhizobium sp. CC1099 TaxID=3039160 RepID=UPI0024B11609|nr:hypothetical protein [Rhizobium sp. CC1099]WFU89462.1 hypothetical protein QA644_10685 [Rhizobium sp. CC1099]
MSFLEPGSAYRELGERFCALRDVAAQATSVEELKNAVLKLFDMIEEINADRLIDRYHHPAWDGEEGGQVINLDDED